MRIIVLQLARFGDLYQTWPSLKALRRSHPQAEIHVLARERFRSALDGLEGIVVHALPSADILRPVFEDRGEGEALAALNDFLAPLKALNFDRVINLSFSPLSSYLTDILSEAGGEVRGYTRFGDGTLAIADDMSAYFYAQVGIERANRYHLGDIFAAVAGVDLLEADFNARVSAHRAGIIVHLGASSKDKVYAPELWVKALKGFKGHDLTLIGSADEEGLSREVEKQCGVELTNLVGQTTLPQLFDVIGDAELLIGADSAPLNIASLTGTPVLNLSSKTVNFFETGPRAAGSRVLYADQINAIPPECLVEEAEFLLRGVAGRHPQAVRPGVLRDYELHALGENDFAWRLIQALYTNSDYPAPETETQLLAFQRLHELADLARIQFARWDDEKKRPEAAGILAKVDELLVQIARHEPDVGPLVEWFQTRRLNIPPGSDKETLERTVQVFNELELITSVYRARESEREWITKALSAARVTLPEMRECDLGRVEYEFQNLIVALERLANGPTKVGAEFWSGFLRDFSGALEARDYVTLADLTESQLLPELSRRMNADSAQEDVLS